MYMTFQYLTVSCIPAIGHVYDISIPDSVMYTCCRSCIGHFNTWQFCVYLQNYMYRKTICTVLTRNYATPPLFNYKPNPPFLATSMGGGGGLIILIYTPPFLAVEHTRGNSKGRFVHHCLVRLAMKLLVAQFCRAMDHESMKAQSVCVIRNAMQQSLCRCIAGQ